MARSEIMQKIEDLSEERERLLAREGSHHAGVGDHRRLADIEHSLGVLWDLRRRELAGEYVGLDEDFLDRYVVSPGTTLPTITGGQGSVSGREEGRVRDTTDRRDFARVRVRVGDRGGKGYDRGILLQGLQGSTQEPGYGATSRTVPGGRLPGTLCRTYAPYSSRGVGFLHSRGDRRAQEVDLGGVQGAALRGDHKGHPLRHQVVEAGHQVGRGLHRHVARWGGDGGRVRYCLLRR